MKTGTSGSVSTISPAETRSIVATKASTAIGHDDGQDGLRQVAGEGRLERIDAGHGERVATSALSAPSSAAGCSRSRRSTSLEPQVCQHARRRAGADDVEPPGRRSAPGGGRDEERERGA